MTIFSETDGVRLNQSTRERADSFDRWVQRQQRPPLPATDREQFIGLMRSEGRTLEEIGEALGITRERVRQLGDKHGYARAKVGKLRIEAVVAALRDPTVNSYPVLAARLGVSTVALVEMRAMALNTVATRLFHWRRVSPRRQRYAAVIRELAVSVRRTPTAHEIAAKMDWPTNQVGPELTRVFGSIRRAMLYCDLAPRGRGFTGHTDPETCQCYAHRQRRADLIASDPSRIAGGTSW